MNSHLFHFKRKILILFSFRRYSYKKLRKNSTKIKIFKFNLLYFPFSWLILNVDYGSPLRFQIHPSLNKRLLRCRFLEPPVIYRFAVSPIVRIVYAKLRH